MKKPHILATCAALHLLAAHTWATAIVFSYSGQISTFITPDPDLDFLIGDQYSGTYTFNSAATSVPVTGDASLSVNYSTAVTAWTVTFPRLGRTFTGNGGDIQIGNDSPSFFLVDRYVVTMLFPSASNPLFPSGRSLRFMQIDLADIQNAPGNTPAPADLLSSTALPLTPPNLNLITPATQGSASGHIRFVQNDNQVQTITTGLVPEPGYGLFGALLAAGWVLGGGARSSLRKGAFR